MKKIPTLFERMAIYWKIPAMFVVGAAEFLAVMMGYMCKEGDDD